MTDLYDQDDDPTSEIPPTAGRVYREMWETEPEVSYVDPSEAEWAVKGVANLQRRPGRHYRARQPHGPLVRGLVIGLSLSLLITAAVYALGRPAAAPKPKRLDTVVELPAPTSTSSTSTTVQPGPPATVTVDGTSAPNPLLTQVPGVVYAPPAYPGASRWGLAPTKTPQPQEGGLPGCSAYAGSVQVGAQYPARNGACNPGIYP